MIKHLILMLLSLRAQEPMLPEMATPDSPGVPATLPAPGSTEPMPSEPPPRGTGMLATGGVFTVIGMSVVIAASVEFARTDCSESTDSGDCWRALTGAVMMPFGVVGLAVGVPLLGVGGHRNHVWRKWQRARGLALRPQFGRSRGAWTMGLELRF